MKPVMVITRQYDGEEEGQPSPHQFFFVEKFKEQLQTILQTVASAVARHGVKCTVRVYLYRPQKLDEYCVTRGGLKSSPVWIDNRTNKTPYTCTYCGQEVQAPLSYHEGYKDCALPSQQKSPSTSCG